MRTRQILVLEWDGRLANILRRAEANADWAIREPRRLESCLKLLRGSPNSVLIVRIGRDLIREFAAIERVSWLFPETDTIVVVDAKDPLLANLAWDLGARFVLMPPLARDLLAELVAGFLKNPHGQEPDSPTAHLDDEVEGQGT